MFDAFPKSKNLIYWPQEFHLDQLADRNAFELLLTQDKKIEIFDQFEMQVSELIENRHPSRKLNIQELSPLVKDYIQKHGGEKSGTWFYYPWSHRLVRTLDRLDFIELRTKRNRYKITDDEQHELSQKKVGVIGLSVGQSVALTLAMERGFGELRIADFDELGLSNLNRIRAGIHEIGDKKVHLTAREISEIDPYLNIKGFEQGLTDANMDEFFFGGGKLDLVIDECDDLRMKFVLRQKAKALGIPVVMDTSDNGLIDVERFDLEPHRPLFHGLIDNLNPDQLRNLSTEDKVPHVVKIIGDETISSRMIASMVEVGESIKSWPQLASAVVLGGGLTCDTVRRILLNQFRISGRFFVELESIISEKGALHSTPTSHKKNAPSQEQLSIAEPHHGDMKAIIKSVVQYAISAPSGGNCQPWKWQLKNQQLFVIHDKKRSESFLDFGHSAAMLALGAACENAILAFHHFGYEVKLEVFPKQSSFADTVACLSFSKLADQNSESHQFDHLFSQIPKRYSNRKFGRSHEPLDRGLQDKLNSAIHSIKGAQLQLLQGSTQLNKIGDILGQGDRVRFLNKQLHGEMMSEVRWSEQETLKTRDGIDLETLELTPADRAGILLCRSWPAMNLLSRLGGGVALEKISKKAVQHSSAVGLLTMPESGHQDFFQGGRALQRFWLTATELGISLQPMSSLPYLFARLVRGAGEGLPDQQRRELEKLRIKYEELFSLSPQNAEVLLFRLSFADPGSARSLRLHVDDVLEFSIS